ncbi:hypothetical protein LOD99_7480 [Oopsacas minuta]|uniref:Uncharacterized protein n=1 Tax=Oopsacas minuta TaxID=111878 RepID=A0AAV7JWM2_9METZ|nr:hypothetical protein LOD99_7480 [Oopsacas minuta]
MVKRMSDTAGRYVRCYEGLKKREINKALEAIVKGLEKKADTRQEACTLILNEESRNRYTCCCVAPNTESFSHQQSGIAIKLPGSQYHVAIYESLREFIGKLRTRLEEFEAEGKKISECDHYCQAVSGSAREITVR